MPKLNHPNFGDVQSYKFLEGSIVEVYSEDDTADVSIPGAGTVQGVPIHYHCDGDVDSVQGGSAAFSVGDSVIVRVKIGSNDPQNMRVLGFTDGAKSCGGDQILRLNFESTSTDEAQGIELGKYSDGNYWIDGGIKKFGGYSLAVHASGISWEEGRSTQAYYPIRDDEDALWMLPEDVDYPREKFTFHGFFRLNSSPSTYSHVTLFGQSNSVQGTWLEVHPERMFAVRIRGKQPGSSDYIWVADALFYNVIPIGRWFHLAYVVDGARFYVFIDGRRLGSWIAPFDNFYFWWDCGYTPCRYYYLDGVNWYIWNADPSNPLQLNVDAVELTKEVKWTSNFTPPDTPPS